jgi:hypothetical protein
MPEQSGPGWWQAPDGHGDQSQERPHLHVPRPSPVTAENPKDDDTGKGSRSLGDRITSIQGILVIATSLVTLIFGGGSVLVVMKHFASHKAPLTIAQVTGALLASSDLAVIDKNLTSADIQFPGHDSCEKLTVAGTAYAARALVDKDNIEFYEQIEAFSSANDAHIGFGELSRAVPCSLNGQFSDISSGTRGLCEEGGAWHRDASSNNKNYSVYLAIMRCGRTMISIIVLTYKDSSFDNTNNLFTSLDIAVPKVRELS